MTWSRMLWIEGRVFGGEAVGQLHEHLGRAEFGAVESAGERVDGFGLGDELLGLGVGEAAGIGELRQVGAFLVEVREGIFGADEDDDGLAAFLGVAGADDFNAAGMGGEGVVVAQNVSIVGELFGRADVVAEDVAWGRDGAARGQMIDQRAEEFRLGGPGVDVRREVGIHGLGRGRGGSNRETGEQHHSKTLKHELRLRLERGCPL